MNKIVGVIVLAIILYANRSVIINYLKYHIPYETVCSERLTMPLPEYVQNLLNKLRGETSPDEARSMIEAKLADLDAKANVLASEYEQQVATAKEQLETAKMQVTSLESQVQSFTDSFNSRCAAVESERAELESALQQLGEPGV